MKIQNITMSKIAYAILGFALAIFLSCTEIPVLEFPQCAEEDKCNGQCYDKATQFCYNNSAVGSFCGINPQKSYNPDLYECKAGKNGIYLKGGVTDNRDSKYYDAVLIGEQVWMAKNLNHSTDKAGVCYCPNCTFVSQEALAELCAKSGRLYDWAMVMDFDNDYCNSNSCDIEANKRGICPAGWHIPSDTEWGTLMHFINSDCPVNNSLSPDRFCIDAGTKLKSVDGWDRDYLLSWADDNIENVTPNTDDYGFAALPSGSFRYLDDEWMWSYIGFSPWWSTSEHSNPDHKSKYVLTRMITYYSKNVDFVGFPKIFYLSVRCLKDN
jgi:uncharacterized protein (TIGR02145 family)